MSIICDGSAVVACLEPDEVTDSNLESTLWNNSLVAPPIWPDEVTNALLMMMRGGRVTAGQVDRAMLAFVSLSAEIEWSDRGRLANAVYPLAVRYGLTIYDASYLELAQHRKLPLATLDDKLRAAAKKARVKVL